MSVSDDFNKYGGSYLLSNKAYEDYIQGYDVIGRPDGQFMAPSNQIDDLLQSHPNNPREWERQLGLGENSLGDSNIRRVDVYDPQSYNPRLPSSDLSGSNDKFISGGKTAGGLDECVIDRFPNPESNPSVGKITNLDNRISKESANGSIDTETHSPSNKVADGGGARAPNKNERGSTENNTTNSVSSQERGSLLEQNNSALTNKSPNQERGVFPEPEPAHLSKFSEKAFDQAKSEPASRVDNISSFNNPAEHKQTGEALIKGLGMGI